MTEKPIDPHKIVGEWIVARTLQDDLSPIGSMPMKHIASLWMAGQVPPQSVLEKIAVQLDALYRRRGKAWDAIAGREVARAA